MRQPCWSVCAALGVAVGTSVFAWHYAVKHAAEPRCPECERAAEPVPPPPAEPPPLPELTALPVEECPPEVIDLAVVPASFRTEEPPLADGSLVERAVFIDVPAQPNADVPALMPYCTDTVYRAKYGSAEEPSLREDPNLYQQYPGLVPPAPPSLPTPAPRKPAVLVPDWLVVWLWL